jgi:hypothetical protein
MDSAEVADKVRAPIIDNRFYVLPHDDDAWLAPIHNRIGRAPRPWERWWTASALTASSAAVGTPSVPAVTTASRLAVVIGLVGDVRHRGDGPDRRRADSL